MPGPDDDDGAELDALVDQVLGQRPRPVDWTSLDGTARTEQWAALNQWVRWLVGRYALDHREVPPCWHAHGDLVEELSALRTAHLGAFDPSGPASGPAEWHQIFANTRARLQLWVARTGCRAAEHRPPVPPTWALELAPDEHPRSVLNRGTEVLRPGPATGAVEGAQSPPSLW